MTTRENNNATLTSMILILAMIAGYGFLLQLMRLLDMLSIRLFFPKYYERHIAIRRRRRI